MPTQYPKFTCPKCRILVTSLTRHLRRRGCQRLIAKKANRINLHSGMPTTKKEAET